ncbi:MAG: hypothetical protein WB711_14030 [Terriglobales bacterium]
MRKTKATKVRKRPRKAPSGTEKSPKRVDLEVIGEQITNLVGNRAIKMVKNTMKEVDQGHYLAMKYLFEMIGLCPAAAPEKAVEEDSLAKTLLQRLRLPEPGDPGSGVTKECVAGPVEQESDAVE